jgi:hypothetical protein
MNWHERLTPSLRWFFARLPVDFLKLEIDVRELAREFWS